jgi:tetratricopeptide (TPR) repeat protein
MRDPNEEAAMLTALSAWLRPCELLVTFNGKAFDVPLVQARYILQRRDWPLSESAHLDLLTLARRLWRDRLASRALGALERDILGAVRTHDDVPGWLIPMMYVEYLKTGDARPLKGVFYHNAMDIVAMAALLGHIAQLIHDPFGEKPCEGSVAAQGSVHPIDYVSLGKIYEGMGEYELAAQAYERGMADRLPNNAFNDATQHLAYLRRKQGQFEQMLELWREAAKRGELYAYVALAKHYEHHARDYAEAERLTCEALTLAQSDKFSGRERRRYVTELEHRLERVRRKRSQ